MLRDESCGEEERFEALIRAARAGDEDALGRLVDECREYLLLVANQDLDASLRPKLGASDVVQTAMLSAHRAFADFKGDQRAEFLAWIKGILKNDLRAAHRHYHGVLKRQVGREHAIADAEPFGGAIRDPAHTPRTNAVVNEEAALLEAAMSQLSAEHRQVVEMRNWQHMSFSEIGERMGRSADAARKLWARAIVQMQAALKQKDT